MNIDEIYFSKIQRIVKGSPNMVEGCVQEGGDFVVEWQVSWGRDSRTGLAMPCLPISVLGTLNGLLFDEIYGQPKLICPGMNYTWTGTRRFQREPETPFRKGRNFFMMHLVTLVHREIANATLVFEIN